MTTTRDDDMNTSPIFIAAAQGHTNSMNLLLEKSPECSELTDTKGRNILHVAVENKKKETIESLFKNKSLTSDLVNQRDSNGNTPIHLLLASDDLDMMYKLALDERVNLCALNNQNRTPLDLASSEKIKRKLINILEGLKEIPVLNGRKSTPTTYVEWKERWEKEKKEKKQKVKQVFTVIGEKIVVVVTLIATASFAAAFTVPGGFDSNKDGMPILLRKAAYKAFVVADALAFSSSCCVLFGYVRLQLLTDDVINNYDNGDDVEAQDNKKGDERTNIISLQYLLTVISMVAMAIASHHRKLRCPNTIP